jgi:hypothetical protein
MLVTATAVQFAAGDTSVGFGPAKNDWFTGSPTDILRRDLVGQASEPARRTLELALRGAVLLIDTTAAWTCSAGRADQPRAASIDSQSVKMPIKAASAALAAAKRSLIPLQTQACQQTFIANLCSGWCT